MAKQLSPDHVRARSASPGDLRPVRRWVSADGEQVIELEGPLWPAVRGLLGGCTSQAERNAVLAGLIELHPAADVEGSDGR